MRLEMVSLARDEILELRRKLPAVTSEHIMAVYGISETTWRRLSKGQPVKRVTLERMRARYERTSATRG